MIIVILGNADIAEVFCIICQGGLQQAITYEDSAGFLCHVSGEGEMLIALARKLYL